MVSVQEFKPIKISRRDVLFSISVLALVVWFGNFFEFNQFTLYADDQVFLANVFRSPYTFEGWLNIIIPYSDGRPLQFGLIAVEGALIKATGSLASAYFLVFLVTAISVLATWWALTYRFSNEVALAAASVFALSPLISIRPFLNGIATPMAIVFLMVAAVLYVSGWRVVSYIVAGLILLTYEMVFPLFAVLPTLLQPVRTRRDFYRLVLHGVICAAMVAGYALFRDKYGTSRLDGALAGRSAIKIIFGIIASTAQSTVNGSWGSVDLSLWMERVALAPGAIAWSVVGFAGFACVLYRMGIGREETDRGRIGLTVQAVIVLAVLMVPAGYVLIYFAYPDGAISVLGRLSRFHGAASVPFSILTGMVLVGLLRVFRRGWFRHVVIAAEAGFLAVLFAFSISHQDDFAAAAERQRLLITQLALDHPMMDPQATFVIRFSDVVPRRTPSIDYEDRHSYYYLLHDLFDFSGGRGARVGPSIRIVHSDLWPQALTPGADGVLAWNDGTWPPDLEHAGHIWCYEFTPDGLLIPRLTPILAGGHNILHEGPDTIDGAVDLGRLEKLPFFALLMGPDAALANAALRPPPN